MQESVNICVAQKFNNPKTQTLFQQDFSQSENYYYTYIIFSVIHHTRCFSSFFLTAIFPKIFPHCLDATPRAISATICLTHWGSAGATVYNYVKIRLADFRVRLPEILCPDSVHGAARAVSQTVVLVYRKLPAATRCS